MKLKAIKNTREKLNIAAKNLGIKEPSNMSITDLLDTMRRYKVKHNSYRLRKKFKRLGLKKYLKKQNVTKSDLNNAIQLNNKSLSNLQKLARLRRIKNSDNLSKEDLIYTLLISEKDHLEDNYMKYINSTTDNEIKAKINRIRILAAKLGNVLTKEERNIIREELCKLENKKRFTKTEKERAYAYLVELTNTLNNKEKYQHSDYHDFDYFGIRDTEHLFNTTDPHDYYKPALIKSAFSNNYEEYKIRGDKNKNLLLKQYLHMITP